MDIAYNKDTLYVYLNDEVTEELINEMQEKVEEIMRVYKIEKLIVKAEENERVHLHGFEWDYNLKHRTKVIIK